MIWRFTYACDKCHAGWQFDGIPLHDAHGPTAVNEAALLRTCRWCGELGQYRGKVQVTQM